MHPVCVVGVGGIVPLTWDELVWFVVVFVVWFEVTLAVVFVVVGVEPDNSEISPSLQV